MVTLKGMERKSLFSGALMAVLATAFMLGAFGYDFGTSRRMGPGYFPLVMAAALLAISPFIALTASSDEPAPAGSLRPLITLGLSIAVFALTIERLGVVPALMASTWCAYLQFPQSPGGALRFLAYSATLAAVLWIVFANVLGLPIQAIASPQ